MNFTFDVTELTEAILPSPTGVKYYECHNQKLFYNLVLFPSPTGVNHYESF
ncbi:hypothetical protein CATMIT_02686 [Catenibacterium mitsuokai DSM 15897]|uniref:hypothetical protein n=1 Tax=Catenibacterium mitsuokai TaxID=100886 RepID=UPI000196C640|nr:hypothetical protein CATMIT_02686 [Catenibacterium mitsuokai DSM 15897]